MKKERRRKLIQGSNDHATSHKSKSPTIIKRERDAPVDQHSTKPIKKKKSKRQSDTELLKLKRTTRVWLLFYTSLSSSHVELKSLHRTWMLYLKENCGALENSIIKFVWIGAWNKRVSKSILDTWFQDQKCCRGATGCRSDWRGATLEWAFSRRSSR